MAEPKKEEAIRDTLEKEKRREEKLHEEAIEESFPASDPPATTQPNSGITGPEEARDKD